MARRGENIYKRKDNRWEGRYVKGYDDNGKAKIGYVYARTYREVKEKLHKAKVSDQKDKPKEKVTFSHYCDEWLILSRNRVKEPTYVKYCGVVNKRIKPALGKYAPEAISTVVVENFSNRLLMKEGLNAKTVRDILAMLRSVLKYMYKQRDDINNIDIIYPKDSKKEMRVLSKEEQSLLIKYLLKDMDEVKFGILLALFTGMRIGEICALRWSDIDLEAKTITVSNTMQRLADTGKDAVCKTKVVIGEAKSDSSKRVIPLSKIAEKLCRKMLSGDAKVYVLTGSDSHYMEPRALQYRLKKYTRACNLEGVHFHTLRHTFATRCVEVGFETKSLSEILGHANTRITLDRYVHSSLELKRANMEKLTELSAWCESDSDSRT